MMNTSKYEQKVSLGKDKKPLNGTPSAFVTYGWCRTAYSVVRSLGQKGIEVHVGDASPLAMSRFSKYCKSFTVLPNLFIDPEEYFDQLCLALKRTGAKVLLPCHEDVEQITKWQKKLPSDVRVAVPTHDIWSKAEDKFNYIEGIAKSGCPVPKTFLVTSREQLEKLELEIKFPIVLKTRMGNSAKGVRIARNAKEFHDYFNKLIKLHNLSKERWPIIQEFHPGEKVCVLGVYNNGKHVASVVNSIKRSKGVNNFGTSTYRVSIDHKRW